MTKKILSIIGVTGALGVGAFALNAVGPAGAAGSSTAVTAAASGPQQEAGECYAGPKDILDGLVANGTINQSQEDAIIEAFKDARDDRGGWRARRARVVQGAVQVAADTIGVSVDDLKAAHQSGKSIADVANEHNVDPATVVQAIVDAGTAKIDTAVANGTISEQRGNALKERLPAVAERIVNHTKPSC